MPVVAQGLYRILSGKMAGVIVSVDSGNGFAVGVWSTG